MPRAAAQGVRLTRTACSRGTGDQDRRLALGLLFLRTGPQGHWGLGNGVRRGSCCGGLAQPDPGRGGARITAAPVGATTVAPVTDSETGFLGRGIGSMRTWRGEG